MTHPSDTTDHPRPGPGFDLDSLDRTDRILLAGCAAIWLGALGAGVAAAVALVDLGRGQATTGETGTPWILYTVIGVSAAVIIAAVPLLLRARRAAQDSNGTPAPEDGRQDDDAQVQPEPARGPDAPTEKFRAATPGAPTDASGPLPRVLRSATPTTMPPAVDQVFLRFGAAMLCAMGVATLLTGVATYLIAVGTETAAWVLYGVAGVVTVGMAGIVWYFLRELPRSGDDI